MFFSHLPYLDVYFNYWELDVGLVMILLGLLEGFLCGAVPLLTPNLYHFQVTQDGLRILQPFMQLVVRQEITE